jgi:hypothetical protein
VAEVLSKAPASPAEFAPLLIGNFAGDAGAFFFGF